MYTLYKVVKEKTNVKGFWIDKDTIYRDNIKIIPYCDNEKQSLFNSGELAVFYCNNDKAIIVDKKDNKTILKHKITIHEKKLKVSYIKLLLKLHGGLTIYRNKVFNDYTIEIWKE